MYTIKEVKKSMACAGEYGHVGAKEVGTIHTLMTSTTWLLLCCDVKVSGLETGSNSMLHSGRITLGFRD